MNNIFPSNEELNIMMQDIVALHQTEREAMLASIDLLARLHQGHAEARFRMGPEEFALNIGLTVDQYFKRLQVHRTMRIFPKIRQLWEAGDISFSHIVAMGPKVTQANVKVMLTAVQGKTKREALREISRISPHGEILELDAIMEVRLSFNQADRALLERAQEVLAVGGKVPSLEIVVRTALEELLKKKDPIQKAERAHARSEGRVDPAPVPNTPVKTELSHSPNKHRPSIPAIIRHKVWHRDKGQCTWQDHRGQRCSQRMMLELDHVQMWCRGGRHEVGNLRLRCRYHNQASAAIELSRPLRPHTKESPEFTAHS